MSSQILNYGLLINKRGIQLADLPICKVEIQPKTIEKSRIKLMFSTKHVDSFLLNNHIDPSAINFEYDKWIFDTVFNENFLPENLPVYMEILCSQAELIFENQKIKPSNELNNTMERALNHKYPYQEIMKVFKDYGYFLPKKIILGHKLCKMTYLAARAEPRFLKSEVTDFNDFATLQRNSVLNKWEDLLKLHNFDTSFLTSINGEDVTIDKLQEWVVSCLKDDLNSLQIISWEKLCPLYEIFDEPLKQKIKLILGSDDMYYTNPMNLQQVKETKELGDTNPVELQQVKEAKELGVKERVLIAGVIPINGLTYLYREKYSDHLNSSNYKIFGKLITQDGEQIKFENNLDIDWVTL
ncbi:7374_t:CDS:2 [Racocetra fulgida]|uniref:7374_t:CDS:1 n=1 Tax=Racocetra fulgida TaxID=60492 RepID=A0A9N9C927_9GLOM|nr:7374_t:CDS:2 [Racocetra fulgida]